MISELYLHLFTNSPQEQQLLFKTDDSASSSGKGKHQLRGLQALHFTHFYKITPSTETTLAVYHSIHCDTEQKWANLSHW